MVAKTRASAVQGRPDRAGQRPQIWM